MTKRAEKSPLADNDIIRGGLGLVTDKTKKKKKKKKKKPNPQQEPLAYGTRLIRGSEEVGDF